MAYWGIAMSARTNRSAGAPTGGGDAAGRDEISKAMTMGAKTQRERDYIAALSVYYAGPREKGDYPARVWPTKRPWRSLPRVIRTTRRHRSSTLSRLNEGITVTPADKNYTRHLKAGRDYREGTGRNA